VAQSHTHSPNYDYVVATARRLLPQGGRVLDFGCGRGNIVALAMDDAPELDICGADTFQDYYASWMADIPAQVASRIFRIEDGRLPFPDASFDGVVSNQVFEHVADAAPALAEIARVLKPGGFFLALFPTAQTWFEPHSGIYFAHWVKDHARQKRYLAACHRRGRGYYRENATPERWADFMSHTIRKECHYRTNRAIRRLWRAAFGQAPRSLAADYMRFRVAVHPRFGRFARLAAPASPLLAFVCHIRAGVVLLARKPG